MQTNVQVRPTLRGGVIGVGLGRFVFAGPRRGKVGLRVAAALAVASGLASSVFGGPEGAKVVSGEARINQQGHRTVIRAGDRAIIEYSRFNIGANERVRFIQPGANARVLNRINGAEPTRIDGVVRANGIVYFVNPAGVMFGQGAVINANGLIAAGANLSNQDFVGGVDRFTGVTGDVVNQGTIISPQAALIGQHVMNSGVIDTGGDANGIVTMVAGDEVVLARNGETMSVRVSPDNAALRDPARAGVENTGRINARGGRSRIVAGDMYSLAIKDTGTTVARDVKIQGRGSGLVQVGGRIDTSNQAGEGDRGGRVEVTGQNVALTGASIDASGEAGGGKVFVGGQRQGAGGVRAAQTAYMSQDSTIDASAKSRGAGGEVIVWSDTHSAVYGTISATGGRSGGNGGFVETSGKQTLDLRGASVDASARHGAAGTWLLDPFNVTITNAGVGVDDIAGNNYTPTGDNALVSASSISSALSGGASGTNVVITTGLSGSPGTQSGHLVVAAPITKNSTNNATLTLQAAGDLVVGQAITAAGGGRLNVDLLAEASIVSIDAPITTGGGTFTSVSGGATTINNTIDTRGSGVDGAVSITAADVDFGLVTGDIASGTGNIALVPTAGVTNVNINAGSSEFAISAADLARLGTTGFVSIGALGGSQTVTMNSSALDLSGTPSVYSLELLGDNVTLNNALTMGAGKALSVTSVNDITLGGTITFAAANANNSVALSSDMGNVTVNQGINTSGGTFFSAGNDFTLNAPVLTQGGGIGVFHNGTLNINNSLNASGGSGTGQVDLSGADVVINTGTGSVSGGVGGVNFVPIAGVTTLSIGAGTGAGTFELSDAELARVSVANGGTIRLGQSGGTYGVNIGNVDVSGVAGQSGANYFVGGGITTFVGSLTLRQDASVAFDVGSINGHPLVQDVGFAGTGGTLSITSAGGAVIGTNATTMGAMDIGGFFDLGLRNSVTQSGAMTVSGSTVIRSLNNSGASITLTDAGNSFTGPVVLQARDLADSAFVNGSITLTSSTDLVVTQAETLGSVDISSGGTMSTNSVSAGTTVDLTAATDLTTASVIGTEITLTAGDNANVLGAVSGTSRVTVRADDVAIDTATGSLSASAGDVIIEPGSLNSDIAINDGLMGGLSLSAAELQTISASGNLIIGRAGGTGEMRIGGLGAVDLSVASIGGLALRAGDINFTSEAMGGGLTLPDNTQLSLIATGAISGRNLTAPDVVIGGNSSGVLAIADGGITLWTSTSQFAARSTTGDVRLTNTGGPGLTISQLTFNDGASMTSSTADGISAADGGLVQIENGGTMALSRAITTLGGFVDIASSGTIFVPGTTDSRVTADRLRVSVLNGTIGGGSTLHTTLGRAGVNGRLEASARFGLDINNGFGMTPSLNLDPVTLSSTSGLVKLVNTGTIVQAAGTQWTGAGFDVQSTGNFIWLKEGLISSGNVSIRSPRVVILSAGKLIDGGINDVTLVGGDLALEGSIISRNTTISGEGSGQRTIGVGTATGDMTIDNGELSRIGAQTLTINGDTVTQITIAGVDLTGMDAPERVIFGAGDPTGKITFNGSPSLFKAVNALANNGVRFDVNVTTSVDELFVNADFDNMAAPSAADDAVSFEAGVQLTSAGQMTLLGATGGLNGEGNLTLRAGEGVTIGGAYTNLNGNTTIDADTDDDGAGVFRLNSGSSMTLGDAMSGRMLSINAGDIDLGGSVDLGTGSLSITRSTSGELWLGDVTGAPTGAMQIDEAELARISAGSIALGGSSTTLLHVAGLRNNVMGGMDPARMSVTDTITLAGADITITPSALLAEQADLVIVRATGGSVGVGTATGDMTIDTNELNRISGKSLTIRNINTSSDADNVARDIVVRDVVEGDLSLVPGGLSLTAGNRITLTDTMTGDASRFRFGAFNATANDGVIVNASITTTTGDLVINGDANDATDDTDGIQLRLGRTLTSARDLILDGNAPSSAQGGLTLTAARDVSILTSLTTQGETVVNADSDADGEGAFIVGVNNRLNTSSNNLTITAADLRLGGTGSAANAVALQSGAGSITFDRSTVGSINVGEFTKANATSAANPVIITNGELGRILGTGLTIGGVNTNQMLVQGVTSGASDRIAGVTSLKALASGGTITFNTTASTFNTLSAAADAGITVDRTITADVGGIELDGAANTGGFGDGLVTVNANLAGSGAGDSAVRSNMVLGATTVTVSGKNVTFNGTINSDTVGARALVVNSIGDGTTTFNADLGTTRRLASVRTNEDGDNVVAGSILAQQFINLGGDVEMTGSNPTFETTGGTGIRFGGVSRIRGTITAAGTTGDIRFADRTTATNTVNITTLGGGEVLFRGDSRLRGSVTTSGDGNINFGQDLITNGDLTLEAQDTGIIAFQRNIYSVNGAHDLAITVARPNDNPATPTTNAPNPLPPIVPTVRFSGAVGKMRDGTAAPLGDLSINAGGRTVVPRQATIVGVTGAGLDFNLSGDFVVGQNEKITSLGGVAIKANKISVGDISAKDDITLTAMSGATDALKILNRPVQQLLQVDFNPDATTQTLSLRDADDGLDIVSAFGIITFNRRPMIVGTGPSPRLATGTGELGGDQSVYQGLLTRQFQNTSEAGAVPEARYNDIARSGNRFLDLIASGPSTANFASGVAQAIPRDNRVNVVGQESSIDSATKEALSDMALNPREPNVRELLDLLIGAATFDDTPGKVGPAQASDYRVVLNRLPYLPTRTLADSYLEIFGERAARAERMATIKKAFSESAKHYRESEGIKSKTINPDAFRVWLENNQGEVQTFTYVSQLSEFFEKLSALGLTVGEENRVRGGLLRQVLPSGQFSSVREFERVFVAPATISSR